MPQTFSQMLFHLVFATKHREPLIQPSLQEALYGQLWELTRQQGGELIEIGGMPDHVHLLVQARPTLAVATLVQRLKGTSSFWLLERGLKPLGESLWQRGYAVFTVSASSRERIRRYIRNQPRHHRDRSSRDELLLLLRKHGITIDPERLDED